MWQTGFVLACFVFRVCVSAKAFPWLLAGSWLPRAQPCFSLQKTEDLGEFIRMLTPSRHVVSKIESGFPRLLAEGLIWVEINANTCVDRLMFSLWTC